MNRYDPLRAPDPAQWLALDESERVHMVQEYRRRAHIRLPNALLHATLHVVVENQIAEGAAIPVKETLLRLLSEGLGRHEAVHAIASVLAEHIFVLMKGETDEGDPNPVYFRNLQVLTAKEWRKSGECC